MSGERRALIERLLETAEMLPPEQRAALLDAECGGDAGLRSEVQRLLQLGVGAGSFLERPAVVLAAESGDWLEEAAGFAEGSRIGRYEVIEALGAGGMGEVYRARDTRLGRDVALKFLPRRLSQDAAALERFQREARAASALNHPNICALYDIGEHEGQPYFVMELLEGRTLKQRLAEGPLGARELADIAAQAAAALEAAHGKGIVHRDVKPANIFLTAGGAVKILDFGVAKAMGEPAQDAGGQEDRGGDTLTRTGVLPGTAAYMSPEQIRGEEVDARSDLFALGITLYQAATGELPFKGNGWAEIREAILSAVPPAPRKLNAALPREMERIILRLLERDAGRRQQSAREVAWELARWRAPGTRKKWAWAAVLLAGVVAALLRLGNGIAETHRVVVLPLRNLTGDASQDPLLDAIRDAIAGDLAKLSSLRVISRASAQQYRETAKTAQEVGSELKVDLVVAGNAWREGDRVRVRLRLIRGASGETLWEKSFGVDVDSISRLQGETARAAARAIRLRLPEAEEARLARAGTSSREAFENYVRGRHYWSKRTDGDIERAVAFFRAAIDADPLYAAAYAALADCYNQFGTVAVGRSPREYRPLAIAAAKKAIEIDDENAEAHAALGFARLYDWDWPGAKLELDRALELNPSYASAHVWRASWFVIQHRYEEAVAEVEAARDLDPLSLITQTQVGWIYQFAGREEDAIAVFRRVLAVDPNFMWALWRLGDSLAETERLGEAIKVLEHAQAVHGESPAILARLGRAYAQSGRKADAKRLLEKLDALERTRYVTPHARGEICIGLEDWDCYFAAQEEGFRQRTNAMAYMGVERRVRRNPALVGNPRFQSLMQRMGLRVVR
jgi:TolB-like protein/Tfp pilus assembly protein PilF